MRISRRLAGLLPGLTGLWLLAAAGGPAAHAAEPPRLPVVASFSILGDLARQVGGDRIELQVLVGPGGDAHVVQPTPAMARTVASAALLLSNGQGFEGWMARFLKSAGFKGRHVVVTDGLPPRAASGPDRHGHGHAVDPHAWQDVAGAVHYVARIERALCELDAPHCAGHAQRAAELTRRLRLLDREIRDGWAQVPVARRQVITAHDAFGHYGAAYGVRFLAPQGLSTQTEPSAKGVAALIRQIRASQVRAVFIETVADPRLMEQIGRETGVQNGGALYSDALSGPDGPAPTYEAMMRHNTRLMWNAVREP